MEPLAGELFHLWLAYVLSMARGSSFPNFWGSKTMQRHHRVQIESSAFVLNNDSHAATAARAACATCDRISTEEVCASLGQACKETVRSDVEGAQRGNQARERMLTATVQGHPKYLRDRAHLCLLHFPSRRPCCRSICTDSGLRRNLQLLGTNTLPKPWLRVADMGVLS